MVVAQVDTDAVVAVAMVHLETQVALAVSVA